MSIEKCKGNDGCGTFLGLLVAAILLGGAVAKLEVKIDALTAKVEALQTTGAKP